MNTHKFNVPGFVFLAFVIIVWEVSSQYADSYSFPKASDVAMTFYEDWRNLLEATLITLRRAAIGFLIALTIMLPLGIILGRVRMLGDLVEPVIEFLRPLPPIAIVPLAMMLLGIGDAAKLTVVVFGASFPILINAIEAVKVQDPMQARVGRSLRLSTFERMWLIDFPAALPRIFAGIRLAITVSVLLTVVSEIILSSDGLGDYLNEAQSGFDMAMVLTALVTIAIVSLIVNWMTNRVSRKVLDWHFRRSGIGSN